MEIEEFMKMQAAPDKCREATIEAQTNMFEPVGDPINIVLSDASPRIVVMSQVVEERMAR